MRELLGTLIFVIVILPLSALAQQDTRRIEELERRVATLESRSHSTEVAGGAAFVAGAVCALWAQQTRRNAWLWFFMGFIFNVITLLVLLYKNSQDKQSRVPP